MANVKKVFFIITKSNLGGAQLYVYDIARSLPEGYEATVVTGGAGWLHQVCTSSGIRSVTLASLERDVSFFKDIRTFTDLYTLFLKERPDVVHLNSSKAAGIGACAARMAGVTRIVFTAHGWAFNEKRPAWQKLLIRIISAITIYLSDITICVSKAVLNDMKWLPSWEKKLQTIILAVEPTPLSPREEARKKLQEKDPTIPTDGIWVGTIAELHKNKGLDVGIEAWKLLGNRENIHWVIIGDGEEKEQLKNLAQGVTNIHFTGHINNAANYLSAFDIFLLPSRTEAFGYALLEARNAHVPIIATAVGGIPEVVEHGKTGWLVPKENPDELRKMLKKIIEDPTLLESVKQTAASYMITQQSLANMVKETLFLYERPATTPTNS